MLLAVQLASDLPRITVVPQANGYRAVVDVFEVTQEGAVEAEIARRATEICADKRVEWGKFGSLAKIENTSKELSRVSDFYREFSCEAPKQAPHAVVSNDWTASAKDEADVRQFFETYYSRRDAGQLEAANLMFASEARPDATVEDIRKFNSELGNGARRITTLTWYVNPPQAPRPGAYAALDFIGEFSGAHFYCGYLMLYRLGPSRYEIVREEQNVYSKSPELADPNEVAAMREALCRGN